MEKHVKFVVLLLKVQKSQTTHLGCFWNPVTNGISGYLPYQLVQDFFQQQYVDMFFYVSSFLISPLTTNQAAMSRAHTRIGPEEFSTTRRGRKPKRNDFENPMVPFL